MHRTISAASGVSAASDGTATAVNESLEGLVSAVDELKRSMGMGNQVDFAAVEQFVQKLRQENEEFREFAEQAILVRRRCCRAAGCMRESLAAAKRHWLSNALI